MTYSRGVAKMPMNKLGNWSIGCHSAAQKKEWSMEIGVEWTGEGEWR